MKGIIAAGHELTARAGAEAMKNGGNAFDAAIAGMTASFVCESVLTSPGGGGFMLAHTAEGKTVVYDFFVNMPGINRERGASEINFYSGCIRFADASQEFHIGEGAAAVPGCMAGIATIHERHCSLPLSNLMEAAIGYARRGVTVNTCQAYFYRLLSPILIASKEARKIYAPKGEILREGEKIYHSEMADTLSYLAKEGADAFYRGEIGKRILEGFGEDGLITKDDLEGYNVRIRRPLAVAYRNRRIYTNPPPSSGGCLIAFSAKLLEGYDLRRLGHNTPPYLKLLMEAMRVTDEARGKDFDHRIYEKLLTKQFLSDLNILRYREKMHTNITSLKDTGVGNTTHISVIDEQGNAASVTTSNGVGCGYMIPGTGIMLNNILGEEDLNPHGFHNHEPGIRISSMMAPTLVMRDGKPEIVLGSGGSKRIRSAIIQVIFNMIDHQLSASDAVNAPRIHLDKDILHIEGGMPEYSIKKMRSDGINIYRWRDRDVYFGGVHTVHRDIFNNLTGSGDIRRGGVIMYAN